MDLLCFFCLAFAILGQMWYLIVSIPDLCTLTYYDNNKLACVIPFLISVDDFIIYLNK